MSEMRCVTVFQPYGWAVITGVCRSLDWDRDPKHVGRVWVHAGKGWSLVGERDEQIREAWRNVPFPAMDGGRLMNGSRLPQWMFPRSAILGSVQMLAHRATGCCNGKTHGWHLNFRDPVKLPKPINCHGQPGIWTPPTAVQESIELMVGANPRTNLHKGIEIQ